jgi:hypothetical protein
MMKTLDCMQETQKCFSWRKIMVQSIELDLDISINSD